MDRFPGRFRCGASVRRRILPTRHYIGTFSANLKPLPGASEDKETKEKFWDKHPEAWAECQRNQRDPVEAMKEYVRWLKTLPGEPVFVAYPAAFDFMFVYWYLRAFAGESPFSFSALDIKTYAMRILRTTYRNTTKKRMPKEWFDPLPHTHKALDDAIE